MVKNYPKTFGYAATKYAGLNCIWIDSLGPIAGGLMAGLWKQYDGTVKI